MSRRLIDAKTYDTLVSAFRERPAVFSYAAKIAQCDHRYAKTAWEKGWPGRFAWAIPIKDYLEHERRAARAKAQEAADQAALQAQEARARAQQEAIDTLVLESQMLTAGRRGTAAAGAVIAGIWPAAQKLVQSVRQRIEADPGAIPIRESMVILDRCARITARIALAAQTLITAERQRRGEPTEVIGVQVENLTVEEAQRELSHVADLMELARAEGLVPGGQEQKQLGGGSNGSGNGQVH